MFKQKQIQELISLTILFFLFFGGGNERGTNNRLSLTQTLSPYFYESIQPSIEDYENKYEAAHTGPNGSVLRSTQIINQKSRAHYFILEKLRFASLYKLEESNSMKCDLLAYYLGYPLFHIPEIKVINIDQVDSPHISNWASGYITKMYLIRDVRDFADSKFARGYLDKEGSLEGLIAFLAWIHSYDHQFYKTTLSISGNTFGYLDERSGKKVWFAYDFKRGFSTQNTDWINNFQDFLTFNIGINAKDISATRLKMKINQIMRLSDQFIINGVTRAGFEGDRKAELIESLIYRRDQLNTFFSDALSKLKLVEQEIPNSFFEEFESKDDAFVISKVYQSA